MSIIYFVYVLQISSLVGAASRSWKQGSASLWPQTLRKAGTLFIPLNPLWPDSVRLLPTSKPNPTGLAMREADTVIVLNSGNFSERPEASLDFFSKRTETRFRTVELGSTTTQVAGRIAITPDGKTAVIGTAAYKEAKNTGEAPGLPSSSGVLSM